jgi:YidC/Oxa1 family membrane protein insertase
MDESKLNLKVKDGWVAMLQHYFVGSWVPTPGEENIFYSDVYPGQRYTLGAYTPSATIQKGGEYTFNSSLVAGPKLQNELREIAPGLDLTVDYGWLTVIAQPIFWLLGTLHGILGNWGWSIIVLTLLIKLAFYKLSETSYRSMANMRKMTPRMNALKERYGEDKQRLNQEMMNLYKKEKINPLGGCLPILVQIPVFIALYWVLMESVELRQAPFMLWIQDLSVKDPFFVLPIIMGASMFIQQKLNPTPPDPMQAKIMMALPFVFTILFLSFPAGLVLYWVVNNVLSIAQQWYITRQIEKTAR